MPARAEIQCEISDQERRMTIEDLANKNGGSPSISTSPNFIKIEFMDKSDAQAFKKQCEKIGLVVSIIIF